MTRLRVLQVNKLYAPDVGGIERVVQDIAEGLRAHVDGEVLACRARGLGRVDTLNGVRIHRAASLGRLWSMPVAPLFPWQVRAMAREMDIVHFHSPFPLGELSALFLPSSTPTVVTWHSDIVRQRLLLRVHRHVLRRFLDRVHRVMVTSPPAVGASAHLRPVAAKCEVVPLGVDVQRFALNASVRAKALDIRRTMGEPLVLFVGRLVYYKGLEYLIAAMRHVRASLLVVGTGGLHRTLEQQAAREGVGDRVHFLTAATDEDVVACFHACDVFALPSIHNSEAFGLVQVEAMACGKPVVNTALPTGVPFVSVDGVTGLTVPPRDSEALAAAIGRLLEDRPLREHLGTQARARVQREFTRERMLERVVEVYRRVAGT